MQIPLQIGIDKNDFKKHNLCFPSHDLVKCISIGTQCLVCSFPVAGECYKCKICGIKLHVGCVENLVSPCYREDKAFVTSGLINHYHLLEITTFTSPTYCQICDELLVGFSQQGYKCGLCGMTFHSKCLKHVNMNCKPYKGETDFCHHFVKGAGFGEKCVICNSPFVSGCVGGIRCSWCGMVCHQCCVNKAPKHCSYGILSEIIISPDFVTDTDQLRLIENYVPKVIAVNVKSGGRTGHEVINLCFRLLNPLQVFDIIEGWDPLFKFVELYGDNFILIVAGGDGTIGWALTECERHKVFPQIVTMPLGTGNDLARSLGWGSTFDGKMESIKNFLAQIDFSVEMNLDRWKVIQEEKICFVFNNYFSFGIDAEIVADFHSQRKANPKKFDNTIINKMTYGLSYFNAVKQLNVLNDSISFFSDGHLINIGSSIGICFLNIPSYGGGCHPWGALTESDRIKGWREPRFGDKIFEVFGFDDSIHVAKTLSGMASARKITQTKSIVFIVKSEVVNCQCDGEPIKLEKGKYEIQFDSQVHVLRKLN